MRWSASVTRLVGELIYADRDPEKVAMREWYAQAFPATLWPLRQRHERVGCGVTRDDLVDLSPHVRARKLEVVAVGDIDAAELGKMIDDVFGGLPQKPI